MTTIAADGKSMAGDGYAARGDLVTAISAVKIGRIPDGRIVGCAGDKPDCIRFRTWLEEGGEPPKFKDFCALVLHPDGSLTYHTDSNVDGTPTEAPNAIGTGEALAIGAMEAGASPEEAIKIAAKRDLNTGGKITVLERTLRAVA